METRYHLDTSIFYYSELGCLLLTCADLVSERKEELEKLMDELPGEYYYGEYTPTKPCVKYSVALLKFENGNDASGIIKEKYYILDLKDFNPQFWSLFNKSEFKE